jgi:hypothetical protein
LLVRVAKGGNEGGFFDGHAVAERQAYADENHDEAGPVSEGETYSSQGNQDSSVRRVPNVGVGSVFNNGLACVNGYVIREKAAEKRHGVKAIPTSIRLMPRKKTTARFQRIAA